MSHEKHYTVETKAVSRVVATQTKDKEDKA